MFLPLFLCSLFKLSAQSSPFGVYIEPFEIPELGGLQSFVWGQHDGKWLIVGGRLDGLHRRQPFAAFDVAGNNNQIIVVNPVNLQKWNAPLTSLPVSIQEQLSSTNMQFIQTGDNLYVTGGYGYNAATAGRKTFENLTAIHVPSVISAVINNTSFTDYFRQINDSEFAVTGGHLEKINDTYYLVGGHRFDGNYNPMGNPTFTQTYTNAIRKFKLSDDGSQIIVTHLPAVVDEAAFHRRDFNVVPQILPDGSPGLTAFSGVFQTTADVPFLNCVHIDSVSYEVNNNFQQYFNHYHCGVLPVYSAMHNEMHTIFFGGIAQYYENGGQLIQDDNVPFVSTIARVTRNADGVMAEYKLPVEMPGLLGAGSEIIPVESIAHYENHVLKMDELTEDSTLAGFLFGGINSTAKNIFFTNTGSQSSASNIIFKVYVIKNQETGIDILNSQSKGSIGLQILPNPNNGVFSVQFKMKLAGTARITVTSSGGELIEERIIENLPAGLNNIRFNPGKSESSGIYLIKVETPGEVAVQKIILNH